MLERYLDNLTSYAETVCDSFPGDIEVSTDPEDNTIGLEVIQRRSPASSRSNDVEAETASTDSASRPIFSMPPKTPPQVPRETKDQLKTGRIQLPLGMAQFPNEEESEEESPQPNEHVYQEPCDLPIRSREPGPLETLEDKPFWASYITLKGGTSTSPWSEKSSKERSEVSSNDTVYRKPDIQGVQLLKGNFVLDCPVPEWILSKVPHAVPPERDEFTHRYYISSTIRSGENSSHDITFI